VSIAAKVRELRVERHWNQRELANRLGISQSWLSKIERGEGSFTAEQFVLLLQLFNAGVSQFVDEKSTDLQLQNALERLGAVHLRESDVMPSERLGDVNRVVVEVLVDGSARLVPALAPVLVVNTDHIGLHRIESDLVALGKGTRLGWLVENVNAAIQHELSAQPTITWRRQYLRSSLQLTQFLDSVSRPHTNETDYQDILDSSIRSSVTLTKTRAACSSISKRWNIITALRPEDFSQALQGVRVSGLLPEP